MNTFSPQNIHILSNSNLKIQLYDVWSGAGFFLNYNLSVHLQCIFWLFCRVVLNTFTEIIKKEYCISETQWCAWKFNFWIIINPLTPAPIINRIAKCFDEKSRQIYNRCSQYYDISPNLKKSLWTSTFQLQN